MKDERAGVVTSDSTVRLTTSISRAADKPTVEDITVTALIDSHQTLVEPHQVLVEMWAKGSGDRAVHRDG